ncbi:MAG: hypothetical protein KGL62_15225, partial [Bradyrhizobium sp.]|uniref:hypothetical protein n=1 Tax=Bradyrhizobium sp. TaxID=376 RepID=UPI0023A1E23F
MDRRMLDDVRASININRPTSGWSNVWFFAGVFLLTRIGSEEALTRRRAGGVDRQLCPPALFGPRRSDR